MFEVLERKELCHFHEVIVGVLVGTRVDEYDGVGFLGPGNEVNDVQDNLLDAAGLPCSDYDIVTDVPGVVELGTEGGVRQDRNDHFVGRLFQL